MSALINNRSVLSILSLDSGSRALVCTKSRRPLLLPLTVFSFRLNSGYVKERNKKKKEKEGKREKERRREKRKRVDSFFSFFSFFFLSFFFLFFFFLFFSYC